MSILRSDKPHGGLLTWGWTAAWIAWWALGPIGSACADFVWVRDTDGEVQRRGGEIVDFRADAVVLRRSSARTERIPTHRVVRWETSLSGAHQRAEIAFESHDWQSAQAAYEEAMRRETREWLQRYQLARVIWCERNRGDDLSAARNFLVLTRNDPSLLYLDAAPIHWKSKPLSGSEKRWAVEHLRDETFNVSRLIAASWLLAGPDRADALGELQKLALQADERIALLATMQQWRARLPGKRSFDRDEATKKLESLPVTLRAGGCYILGQAYDLANDSPQATVWYLRVALLYPHDARLAPDSLWRAADRLQAAEEYDAARRLFFELSERYPGSVEAQQARKRLNQIQSKEGGRP